MNNINDIIESIKLCVDNLNKLIEEMQENLDKDRREFPYE